jgi:hypothetical protein
LRHCDVVSSALLCGEHHNGIAMVQRVIATTTMGLMMLKSTMLTALVTENESDIDIASAVSHILCVQSYII